MLRCFYDCNINCSHIIKDSYNKKVQWRIYFSRCRCSLWFAFPPSEILEAIKYSIPNIYEDNLFRKSLHCFLACLVLWLKEHTFLLEGFPGLKSKGCMWFWQNYYVCNNASVLERLTACEFYNMGITEFCDNIQNLFFFWILW